LEQAILRRNYPEAVFVSAVHGNISELQDTIFNFFERRMETVQVLLDYQQTRCLAEIYEWSRVNKIDYREEGIFLELTSISSNLKHLRHHLPEVHFEKIELMLPN
jgi:50S ribosomal subunit-associated GTPase HflX